MKNIYIFTFLSFLWQLNFSIAIGQSGCPNADFSQGNFTGWNAYTGHTPSYGTCCPTPGVVAGRHTIISAPGTDPNTGNALSVLPPGETICARLGNSNVNGDAERLEYSLTVNPNNALFIYKYAVVLQDPSHPPAAQPRFRIRVLNSLGNVIDPVCGFYDVIANSSIPGFNNYGSIRWKNWTTVGLDLTPYMGQNIRIEFTTFDCDYGGHFGYAYLKCSCSNMVINIGYCQGSSIVTLSAPSGFSYLWSPGGLTTQTITVTNPVVGTTYTCLLTSVNGCQVTLQSILNPTIINANFSATPVNCSYTVNFVDLTTINQYVVNSWLWNFGDGNTSTLQNPSHTYSTSGNYNVSLTSTSSIGACQSTNNQIVNIAPLPIAEAGNNQTVCAGTSVTLTATGGTSYQWNNGVTNGVPFVPIATTTYTVTVTNANGCTATDNVQVTVNSLPIATALSNSPICAGSSLNLISSGGTGYSWSGPNSFTSSTQNPSIGGATLAASGTYTVTVTGTGGCASTAQTTVTVNSNPTATASGNSPICAGQTLNLTSGGGTAYSWSGPNSFTSSTQNPSIAGATPAASGTYIVTVSDANGCSGTDDVVITVNPTPPANAGTDQIICLGQNANLTAFGGGTYQWSNGSVNQSTNVAPLVTTTYTVTVTGSIGGCTSTDDVVVNVNTLPPASAGPDKSICYGKSDALDGSGGTTYTWSPITGLSDPNIANPVANPITTTTYSLTVSDANGCSATDDMILTVYPQIFPSAGPDLSICKAQQSATLNASGGFTYAWSPATGLNNANIANPVATPASTTTYTVTVSDMTGCTGTDAATVTVNPVPTFTYTTDSVLCYSDSSGAINILVSGGTIPYTYAWTPNVSTGPIANNIPAGTYQIAISDINGCDTAATITVGEPPLLTLSTSGNVTICNSQSTTISATATGGVGSYTFIWDNGLGTGSSFTVNPATTTTYTVSMTDGNTCTATTTLTVTVFPSILVNVISNPAFICYGGTAVLTATPNGGNGNYTYTWGQGIGISSQSITVMPITTTMYPVTVTDNCGSPQGVDSVEVIVYPLPTVQFTSDTISGCEPLVVTFADNSTPAIGIWQWDFGDPLSGSNNNSMLQNPTHIYEFAGTYTVTLTVTTTNGCIGSYTHQNMIIVFPSPDVSFIMHPDVGSTQNPKITFIDLSTNASTWNWNFGEFSGSNNTSNDQNPQHSYESAGIFTITLVVESPYGCVDSTSNEILIKQDFAIFFPNAFTPNGDSKNDGFRPEGDGVDLNSYQLYIYDRWGEMIFKTNDFYEYWDGKVMGSDKMAEVAVYSWIAFMKDVNGESYTFKGRITLIK